MIVRQMTINWRGAIQSNIITLQRRNQTIM